jgi:hypothetical protein
MRTTGWLVLVVLFGCGPKPPPASSPYRRALLELTRMYREALVAPLCDGHGSGPSAQTWTFESISGTQRCGLLAWDFRADGDWRDRFFAQLQERYWHADAAWIRNHCVGYPQACSAPEDVEGLFLLAHNDAVAEQFKANLFRLERAR